MPAIDLKYGRTAFPIEYDPGRFEVLGTGNPLPALSDMEIGDRLDRPIGSAALEDIVHPGETVLLVVPDATRLTGSGQVVNLIVRRLIAGGTAPHEIAVIFATGIHRRVTDAEKDEIITPFIAQRIKTFQHDARNPLKLFRTGETSGGIPIELNWILTEYDHIVIIGGVTFHYFAGFTGGRKLICPGLASAKTISETHKLAFDAESKQRRRGVGPGLLDGNAVHEAFAEAAATVDPAFGVSTIVNDAGEVTEVFCGDWLLSHRRACEAFLDEHVLDVAEKRKLVVASCGGHPFDINMIQAHKALDAASRACAEGGTIVLLAECDDGLGRDDFLKWFDESDSAALAERLCDNYEVNGQTAWSLMKITERFQVKLVSNLNSETAERLRMVPVERSELRELVRGANEGYFLTSGAKYLIRTVPVS